MLEIVTNGTAAVASNTTMDSLMTVPNYSHIFKFEDEFEHTDAKIWFNRYWTGCFYYVGIYILVIFSAQQWMANRPRYELRGPLICWNLMLAFFSILGACRTIPELFHVTQNIGLYHSVCVPRYACLLSFRFLKETRNINPLEREKKSENEDQQRESLML